MPNIEILNIDCMEYMKGLPDKAFDLAIVDPPYGLQGGTINAFNGGGEGTKSKMKMGSRFSMADSYNMKKWDFEPPPKIYFDELFRISENQIIWGANYFNLPPYRCPVIWDKEMPVPNFSAFELAYTSFNRPAKIFKQRQAGFVGEKKMHPTQKPVKLYRWLLHHYAKQGDKILDTHLGSGSSAIAAHQMGFDFVGCEIDKDYYDAACKRFKEQTMQQSLFNPQNNY